MTNPFKKTSPSPKIGVKTYSVEDVKAANKRFYDKFPGAVEDAAMLKKAMQNPGDEVVKEDDTRKAEHAKMMRGIKIEVETF
jgi:hypothetical protein